LKKFALVVFLLAGCATQMPIAEPPRTMDEAYLYARSGYEVMLEQMVEYRDECFSRPPELVAECKPTVDRMRRIAKDGMTYREIMDAAYHAGDVAKFEGSVRGLGVMQNALKNEIIREAAKQKEISP
jgi:hypothetical protein